MQQIKAPNQGQLPQVKGPEFNDRDRINDLLSTEKYLTTGYNIGAFEANDDALREDLLAILNETHDFQRRLFKAMYNKGWYAMNPANASVVAKAVTDFNHYKTQLPYQTPPAQ